jgi:hypothetical protein
MHADSTRRFCACSSFDKLVLRHGASRPLVLRQAQDDSDVATTMPFANVCSWAMYVRVTLCALVRLKS